ncbi:MAG: hypothetical protein ABJA10_07580 [Aestuariivirga sp.]
MTDSVTIHVSGFKELGAALDEMKKTTAKGVMQRVLKKAAQPVADAAAGMVHVGDVSKPGHQPGRLRDSAKVSNRLSRRQKRLHKQLETTSFTEMFVGFGPLVEAITEEFGTVRGVRPHPAMRPAWDGNKAGVLDSIKRDLATEIETTRARAARRAAAKAERLGK